MMLNMMCFILNHTYNVYMMCIRVMNLLVNVVGGFEAQPNMGWLGGGLSKVVVLCVGGFTC